jgi:NAD(P)-dependent dehydrogenase (short-subunit alcohol dehydrogenase family)
MPTVLITGASRGLGLEFARQYADDGWRVLATCREPEKAEALAALAGEVVIAPLDVGVRASVEAAARRFEGEAVDLLLLNAGIHPQKDARLGDLDDDLWAEELRINVIAQLRVAASFADHVARSERRLIIAMSSQAGSLSIQRRADNYAYRSGKAALNAALRTLALETEPRGVAVVAIGPGYTRTDMGGPDAPHGVEDSVARVRRVIEGLGIADTARFLSRDGDDIPW